MFEYSCIDKNLQLFPGVVHKLSKQIREVSKSKGIKYPVSPTTNSNQCFDNCFVVNTISNCTKDRNAEIIHVTNLHTQELKLWQENDPHTDEYIIVKGQIQVIDGINKNNSNTLTLHR